MQSFGLSYVESLEKKIEEYEMVLKRLNDEAGKAQIREALREEKEDELKDDNSCYKIRIKILEEALKEREGELKEKDEEIDRAWFLAGQARDEGDKNLEDLRRLEVRLQCATLGYES